MDEVAFLDSFKVDVVALCILSDLYLECSYLGGSYEFSVVKQIKEEIKEVCEKKIRGNKLKAVQQFV